MAISLLLAAWRILLELAPWLLLGAAVAGFLHACLPTGFLRRRLAGRGGVANAVLLGIPLPLCSCGVIPTGLGLKKQGASDGATVGFLISTPQTGVDSILVTTALLGLPFALFKVAVAAITGLAGGWLADRVAKPQLMVLENEPHVEPQTASRMRAAVSHGVEMIRSVWRWIVAGVLISAAIEVWLPTDGLAALSGYGGLVGMLAALMISLPLYVCATASAPIAASLVATGMPVGAAMVFLMAGPATNVATIGAVYRTLGARVLTVYLTTIIIGSIAGGLLFGWLIDAPAVAAIRHAHGTPWWAVACAAGLLILFAWFAISDVRRWMAKRNRSDHDIVVSVDVEGMICQSCVAKLEQTIAADPAVDAVRVTLNPGRAEARGTVTATQLKQLVRDAGFSAS